MYVNPVVLSVNLSQLYHKNTPMTNKLLYTSEFRTYDTKYQYKYKTIKIPEN